MRTTTEPLLPILRSRLQGRLLAQVLLFGDRERGQTVAELARALGAHVATVHREVDRLAAAGILETERVGRTRLVRPGTDPPYMPELEGLILKTFGPLQLLRQLLAPVEGIHDAYIFGSWAERYEGILGPAPRDLDLLVVGKPDREEVFSVAADLEARTGILVDVHIRSEAAWERGQEGLVRTIRGGPYVALGLGEE